MQGNYSGRPGVPQIRLDGSGPRYRLIDGRMSTGVSLAEFVGDPGSGGFREMYERSSGRALPMIDELDATAEPARARVNHGRWIVDCPAYDGRCAGTLFVWIEGPHQFLCHVCGNRSIGGKWRRVELPADWADIDAALFLRDIQTERNWHPGESVEQLRDENEALGYAGGAS